MKRLPIVIVMVIAGVFLAFNSMGKTTSDDPPTKYEKILHMVGMMLNEGHYSPKNVNDEFSKKVFSRYFEELDGDKTIFLQQDIDNLKKYSTTIDEEIKGAPIAFFFEVNKIFNQRMEEAAKISQDILSKPFDFTVKETVTTDFKKIGFPASEAARRDAIRRKLKYLVLQRYVDLQDARDASKGKEGAVEKADAVLEKEAREKTLTATNKVFDRYRTKFPEEDKFSIFVNIITEMMDPHTEFMAPVDKRSFDESLSGSFDGIGAQLNLEEGNIKIVNVIPGGPAHKSGEVEAGDIIVKVAQGKDTPVELSGFDVPDAVKLIRGKRGTEVRLTLRKKDGSLKVVPLIREKIVQDESYVRSAVINENNAKIGYIFLPDFYANFNDPTDPHRSAVDVATEVKKLKAEKVDGIVIDLRNNGGGSLSDVIQIAGLFIDNGPVVQVKDPGTRKPEVLNDDNKGVLYDGPLTVLVNEFSASASEIFAAAIQDYGRGIIIGSSSTYGKGSVQRQYGLDPGSNFMNPNAELGALKLTVQKYYRVSGGSVQLKGVVPDIVIPDYYEYLKYRERDNEFSMPYDVIKRADYQAFQPGIDFQAVKGIANARIANDSIFNLIKTETDILAKQDDKQYPLELNQFKAEQKVTRDAVKRIEKLVKLDQALNVSFLKQDESRYVSEDKAKTERYKSWLSNVSKDRYIEEAVNVLNDMLDQQKTAKAAQSPAKTF